MNVNGVDTVVGQEIVTKPHKRVSSELKQLKRLSIVGGKVDFSKKSGAIHVTGGKTMNFVKGIPEHIDPAAMYEVVDPIVCSIKYVLDGGGCEYSVDVPCLSRKVDDWEHDDVAHISRRKKEKVIIVDGVEETLSTEDEVVHHKLISDQIISKEFQKDGFLYVESYRMQKFFRGSGGFYEHKIEPTTEKYQIETSSEISHDDAAHNSAIKNSKFAMIGDHKKILSENIVKQDHALLSSSDNYEYSYDKSFLYAKKYSKQVWDRGDNTRYNCETDRVVVERGTIKENIIRKHNDDAHFSTLFVKKTASVNGIAYYF